MEQEKVINIYGAGGQGKVVLEIIRSMGFESHVVYDNNPASNELSGVKVKIHDLRERIEGPLIITVGDNAARKRIVDNLGRNETGYARAIHPSAIVPEDVMIGEGSVVAQGAIIQPGARIGRHCIINTGAIVDHDCVVDDFAHVSPGAVLCGKVKVGAGTWIGAGSVVVQCTTVGEWTVVGAGAVVVKDLPDNVIAVGNPARVIR